MNKEVFFEGNDESLQQCIQDFMEGVSSVCDYVNFKIRKVMITKEQFIKLIANNHRHNERLDEVEEVLGCAIYDCDFVEYGNVLFGEVLNLLFEEEAADDVNWWLYEKRGRPDYKMWDKDGNEIPTETLDDLWEIVKDFRK